MAIPKVSHYVPRTPGQVPEHSELLSVWLWQAHVSWDEYRREFTQFIGRTDGLGHAHLEEAGSRSAFV